MTIAITGSSGFLGNALVKLFLQKEIEIVCLIRKQSKYSSNRSDKVKFIEYDNKLYCSEIVEKLSEFKPEAFIHCAWKGTFGKARDEYYQFSENIPLTIDSVLLANAVGCNQWIGAGSQAEYGNKRNQIFENEICEPQSLYGKAKLVSGITALELCTQLNIKGVWNRIFSLYGPGDNEDYFIPYVIKSLSSNLVPKLTGCEQIWDYLYIDDAATAFYKQINNSCEGIFNICSGKTIVLKEIVLLIQKMIKNNSSVIFGDIPYLKNQTMMLWGNCDKLKSLTGWESATNLENGLDQTINYFTNK